jgi:glycosyltransferase involved in cell wall biosynthesis
LKVLMLGRFDGEGGIERHVRTLSRAIQDSGCAQVVNLVANGSPRTDRHTHYGYPTIRAACWGRVASTAVAPTLPLLARQLHAEHRFDIVHLHFPDPLSHLAAALLPARVKTVVTWHSDIIRQKLALALYRPLLRRFVRSVDAVIVAAPFGCFGPDLNECRTARQRRAVVPFGLEPAQLTWAPESVERLAELRRRRGGRPALFALGRHVYYKGFDVLIDTMRLIDALLWLGGSGPLTEALKARARAAGLADRVEFVGRIPDKELVAYYEACDVFVLPSTARAEAFGLVQLEAMWCARPVVATRLGTGVEFVNRDGETGLLVPPGDASALAGALNRLLGDAQLRERLGRAGRARVEREFSIAAMRDRTLAVYREVLAPGAAPLPDWMVRG